MSGCKTGVIQIMLNSYKARICDDHIDWMDRIPPGFPSGRAVDVEVSLIGEFVSENVRSIQGKEMAKILQKLADCDAVAMIDDPVLWQRKVRAERLQPGRE